jgi:hypothetical protein
MGMEWLYGLFGGRRVIGCKESSNDLYMGMAYPVSPWRLETDKRLDVVLEQPFSIAAQYGQSAGVATWGKPMDVYTLLPAPQFVYPNPHLNDGQYSSSPLRVGALVRSMAAGAMNDVRSLRLGRH